MRSTTRMVQVDVVAQDKKGQPISDLKQEDFEVSDQGKPQKIAAFSIDSNQNLVGREGPLPPGTFSNLPSRQGASQNFTIILFDTLNTEAMDQANAKREVLGFLQQITPQDRVAIYGLGADLRVMHDFTGDAEALVRAMAYYKTRISADRTSSLPAVEDNTEGDRASQRPVGADAAVQAIIAAMDDFLNQSNQIVANYYVERRSAITLRAMETIASHVAALPGRKSLVWVSGGFPFTYGNEIFQINQANIGVRDFSEAVMRTTRAITDANVAIYPVDARAFMGAASLRPSTSAESGGGGVRTMRQAGGADRQVSDDLLASHSTMQDLADKTGGRATWGVGDVQGVLRRVLDDSRTTYSLAYYPSEVKTDGRFRNIKVSVKRPGVQLRYRRGYYALPGEPLDDAHRQSAINAAAISPLDATGIGLSAHIRKPEAGETLAQTVLGIDAKSLKLELEQETWAGGLEVVFVQFDKAGSVVSSTRRLVPIKLTDAQHQQLLSDGLALTAPLEIKPQCEKLRIILRDATSGAIGTVTAPLK